MNLTAKSLLRALVATAIGAAAAYGINMLMWQIPPYEPGNYWIMGFPPPTGSVVDLFASWFGPTPRYAWQSCCSRSSGCHSRSGGRSGRAGAVPETWCRPFTREQCCVFVEVDSECGTPMRTVHLIRHAKSNRNDPSLPCLSTPIWWSQVGETRGHVARFDHPRKDHADLG